MKVYRPYDSMLGVRIGHEKSGAASLRPWYGGIGAIRLRQVLDGRSWAYQLDGHGSRHQQAVRIRVPRRSAVHPIPADRRPLGEARAVPLRRHTLR
jgi:hypothetical protein